MSSQPIPEPSGPALDAAPPAAPWSGATPPLAGTPMPSYGSDAPTPAAGQPAPVWSQPTDLPAAPPLAPYAAPVTNRSVLKAAAQRTMVFGLLWFIAGIVVSVLTMARTAGSSSHGVILWGLSLYGVVRMVRGFIAYHKA